MLVIFRKMRGPREEYITSEAFINQDIQDYVDLDLDLDVVVNIEVDVDTCCCHCLVLLWGRK